MWSSFHQRTQLITLCVVFYDRKQRSAYYGPTAVGPALHALHCCTRICRPRTHKSVNMSHVKHQAHFGLLRSTQHIRRERCLDYSVQPRNLGQNKWPTTHTTNSHHSAETTMGVMAEPPLFPTFPSRIIDIVVVLYSNTNTDAVALTRKVTCLSLSRNTDRLISIYPPRRTRTTTTMTHRFHFPSTEIQFWKNTNFSFSNDVPPTATTHTTRLEFREPSSFP